MQLLLLPASSNGMIFLAIYRQHASIHAFSHDFSWHDFQQIALALSLMTLLLRIIWPLPSCFLLHDVSVFFWVCLYLQPHIFVYLCLSLSPSWSPFSLPVDAHVCCQCSVWLRGRESQRVCVCTFVRTCTTDCTFAFLTLSFSLVLSFFLFLTCSNTLRIWTDQNTHYTCKKIAKVRWMVVTVGIVQGCNICLLLYPATVSWNICTSHVRTHFLYPPPAPLTNRRRKKKESFGLRPP